MPRRRPPREGLLVNNFLLLAAAIFILPWLAEAQQPQRPVVPRRQQSPHENLEPDVLHTLEPTRIAQQQQHLDTPLTQVRRKKATDVENETPHKHLERDASAIVTLSPADSAVATTPTARRPGITTAGLASPQSARSLEDWEVEDFVLLATIDGKLYARDRKTGKEKWQFTADKPMVETTYNRRNRSAVDADFDPLSVDEYIWVVEPSRDGSIYIYRPMGPNPGLVNTGLTMKKLVEEMAPYSNSDPAITYTGEKKTTMVVVDARNGQILKWFGSHQAIVNDKSCLNTHGLVDRDTEECKTSSTFTIGRTEYIVGISGVDGHQIATLRFSEWVPNNYDQDLQRQYHTTLDNKYIYPSHDGEIIGIDHDHDQSTSDDPGRLPIRFKHKFSSPVVRVFDVARPWGPDNDDSQLVILPQPMPPNPAEDETSAIHRASSVFVNQTEDGSWYAMSGKSYPGAVQRIGQAQCEQQDWRQHHNSWDTAKDFMALVGLHSIDRERSQGLLTISAPQYDDNESDNSVGSQIPALVEPPTIIDRVQSIPRIAANNLVELFSNPILIMIVAAIFISYQRQIRIALGQRFGHHTKLPFFPETISEGDDKAEKVVERQVIVEPNSTADVPEVQVEKPSSPIIAEEESKVEGDSGEEIERVGRTDSLEVPDIEGGSPNPGTEGEVKKKKAHRGKRGGVKHKKGRARSASQSGSLDPKPPGTVDDAVKEAQNMGQQTKLEPDIHTISHDPSDVSGPTIKVGSLIVNTDKLIGTGSNGTMVFEGSFDGREVAVKRMLIQFFEIASQETKLLRESDDHPNVVRYFAQESAGGFLYIALELCPASLSDVIEKPQNHRELAQGGQKDMPHVLYQIANGLQYLHELRIVHRDLKPQNILVAKSKDGRPRLLVSDFGLCKKLEGEQSSFRATTAHAAGTTGWRAPELLLDDDTEAGATLVNASTDGHSGSGALVSAEIMPNGRRATRALDIFSLGLVFFYVLTEGQHPFDCGGRFMREVNVRKGNYNLDPLSVLGDYAFEAKDLITVMLSPDPRLRPTAQEVMSHPFFWPAKKRLNFLCDVSDHFEKETRDPPSEALLELERWSSVCRGDFLKHLGRDFVESMGKQRKYTGDRLLDLLRALRNKKNHYEDMSDKLKKDVGPLPHGYLSYWTTKFPDLLIATWNVVYELKLENSDRFREYYLPAGL